MGLQAAFISIQAICFILNIPPLTWHIMSRNIPASTLLIYLEIMMIDGFVGAIIWGGDNFINKWKGEGWCDLMIRFEIAISIGISSTISCVSFNLLMIFLTNKITTIWFSNKYLKPSIEIFCSIIFPFLISGISYFAQFTRYSITRYTGCSPTFTSDSISVVVFYLWVFLWSFIGTVISVITLILYFKKRKAAREILKCTNSGLSVKRFIRLLVYCILVIIISIVFSCVIGSNLNIKKEFKTTSNFPFNTIFFLDHKGQTYTNRWSLVSISFISFLLFGIGQDAKEMYISILNKLPYSEWIIKKCGLIEDGFFKLFGDKLINDQSKYIFSFWNNDIEGDNESYYDDKSEGFEMNSLKEFKIKRRNNEGNSFDKEEEEEGEIRDEEGDFGKYINDLNSELSIDKMDKIREEVYSPITPSTINHNYSYNDENLRHELQEAERDVIRDGAEKDFDEYKYLYY